MDHAAGTVAKEHVDLVRFDNGCYLAASENVVRHGLALAVFSHPVVWRSVFAGSHIYRGFDAAGKCTDRLAGLAACLCDLALFGHGLYLVVLLQITCRTHHLDRIIDRIYFFLSNHIFHLSGLNCGLPQLNYALNYVRATDTQYLLPAAPAERSECLACRA